ncbi:CrcB protein [Actinoplanes lutulentus]|uniref:Fluoride-specific ion channel FluC n=1 Tax=Actinoplanes lutulentus TaxID=1287878 RepID=A0A327ZBB0_9ACTN|nr:CrcB family protein [Actinoplanes lutulentus]MBB2945185.1 CrcB protein [Actinoplanes lutulentus]RAK31981.1 CrcB protein [Actinoplanes lutulentus]
MDLVRVAAVATGGVLGALTRFAISSAWSGSHWATWLINVTGCFLIGVLYTLIDRKIVRLFLGTGFLGGYTTFSTAAVDTLHAGLPYLAATLIGSLLAVWAGSSLTGIVAKRS